MSPWLRKATPITRQSCCIRTMRDFVLCKFIRYMKREVIQNFGKKLLLSLAAVSFLAIFQSNAQSSQVNLGITLGANYGNLTSNVGSWSGTVGFQGAANLEWRYN